MTGKWLFIITLMMSIATILSVPKKSCYASDKNPYLQFGPTTSYKIAKGKITRPPACQALQVWMVARHGTRYLDTEDYEGFKKLDTIKKQILANHQMNKVSLCQEDINLLKDNVLELPMDKAGKLIEAGKRELYELGGRVKNQFSEILAGSNRGLQYFSTDTHRTKESADYFMKGVSNLNFNSVIRSSNQINQNIIHTYLNCLTWKTETKKYKELRNKFNTGKLMKQVQSDVSQRLGYKELLDMESIMTMYDVCRLQKSWNVDKISPWCAIFSEEELKILEFGVDLYYFYKSGPGTLAIHKKLACPAVKDMIDSFSRRISNPDNHWGAFYFTHHIMLDILQVGLEISSPSNPPTTDNYSSQHKRGYRSSKTMPFAGNILAVLYKCDKKTKVALYQNEEIVQYPGCDKGLCDWEMIKKKFHNYINDKSCTNLQWCQDGKLKV